MTRQGDPFATFDGAYVLGSLSPEDRAAFEQHLKECAACARAVQELAGLPGLLAQVTPDMIEVEPPPAESLPSALKRVRRARRRRVFVNTGVGVAAAVAVALSIVLSTDTGETGTAMTPLGAFPVQAVAAVQPVSGGSLVDMSCSYRGADRGADYLLVAVRRDGGEAELATWWADPDRTAKISIGTALAPGDIQALEIRTTGGLPVLRWNP
ncbi:MAG TPA: zf-HC2 domain-containing protein [Amycolatopsis sp.]|uniref:anti-sigma factor family protein n=1 Tax=Amycolatopsis sp. TaxID=37632 RepID=UPI002B49AA81|nr:zf-HC2 domain-containing protein [Amycolatopsis sp.]HKS46800.1 zf-HC2 domain-containing protein [Amycolatopsis sp.]